MSSLKANLFTIAGPNIRVKKMCALRDAIINTTDNCEKLKTFQTSLYAIQAFKIK